MSAAPRLLAAVAAAWLIVPALALAQTDAAAPKDKAAGKGKTAAKAKAAAPDKDKAAAKEKDKAAAKDAKAATKDSKAAAKDKAASKDKAPAPEKAPEADMSEPQPLKAATPAASEDPITSEPAKAAAPSPLDSPNAKERPWAKGVSPENQRRALDLFREGNALLRESLWSKAVEKYTAAIKLWDHPGIHYNLALALVNLDRPIETHDHLQSALKYGPVPLDENKHEQALRYMILVEKQLTRVDIRCELAGASVKLDGRDLFTGPGRYEGLVTAGAHTIIATKEGFLPRTLNELFPPGDTRSVEVVLQNESDMTDMRRLFPNWIPWTVMLAGVAVGGGSVGLHLASNSAYKAYDQGVNDCSNADPATGGCVPSLTLQAQKSQGDTLQTLAFIGYGVGGAALITGAVLVYVNRLQPYRRSVDVVPEGAKVSLVPVVGKDGAGASLLVSF